MSHPDLAESKYEEFQETSKQKGPESTKSETSGLGEDKQEKQEMPWESVDLLFGKHASRVLKGSRQDREVGSKCVTVMRSSRFEWGVSLDVRMGRWK